MKNLLHPLRSFFSGQNWQKFASKRNAAWDIGPLPLLENFPLFWWVPRSPRPPSDSFIAKFLPNPNLYKGSFMEKNDPNSPDFKAKKVPHLQIFFYKISTWPMNASHLPWKQHKCKNIFLVRVALTLSTCNCQVWVLSRWVGWNLKLEK